MKYVELKLLNLVYTIFIMTAVHTLATGFKYPNILATVQPPPSVEKAAFIGGEKLLSLVEKATFISRESHFDHWRKPLSSVKKADFISEESRFHQ